MADGKLDKLDQTIPPHDHGPLERAVGQLDGRMTGVEGKVDLLTTTMSNGFNDVREQLRDMHDHESSQNGRINELSGRVKIDEVMSKASADRRGQVWKHFVSIAKVIGPIIVTAITVAGAMSFGFSCNGG